MEYGAIVVTAQQERYHCGIPVAAMRPVTATTAWHNDARATTLRALARCFAFCVFLPFGFFHPVYFPYFYVFRAGKRTA